MTKKFVQAYLSDDSKTISGYVSARLLRNLKIPEIDIKVREAFLTLSDYQQNVYMYGLKSAVDEKSQTSQGEVTITFDFVWIKGRWILEMVR